MDATALGDCATELGWAFDGVECRLLTGCECVGVDCERLFDDGMRCFAAFDPCSRPCASNDECASSQYCDWPAEGGCRTGGQGSCRARPEVCAGLDPVCGCDGNDYASPCEAATEGVDVWRSGPCEIDGGAA